MGRLLHFFAERTDSQYRAAPGADDRKRPWQGFAVVLAVGAQWGRPRVPQVGKPPSLHLSMGEVGGLVEPVVESSSRGEQVGANSAPQ